MFLHCWEIPGADPASAAVRQYFLGRKPALRAKNETVSTPEGGWEERRGRRVGAGGRRQEVGRGRREEAGRRQEKEREDRREEEEGGERREEGGRRRQEEGTGRKEWGGLAGRGGRKREEEGGGHCYQKAELCSRQPPWKGAAPRPTAPGSLKPPDKSLNLELLFWSLQPGLTLQPHSWPVSLSTTPGPRGGVCGKPFSQRQTMS